MITSTVPRRLGSVGLTKPTCRRNLQLALSKRAPPSPAPPSISPQRCLSTTPALSRPPAPPKTKDRGPASKEDTQTDFGAMDMLNNIAAPSTAIDACMDDGFALNSGLKVTGAGVLLVGGEAFRWRPWLKPSQSSPTSQNAKNAQSMQEGASTIFNARGQFEVDASVWGVLDLVWPKPDLMVLGTGAGIVPVSPESRAQLSRLGIRVEVQDTRNAAAQFNLLATERGVQQIVGALIPVGVRAGAKK